VKIRLCCAIGIQRAVRPRTFVDDHVANTYAQKPSGCDIGPPGSLSEEPWQFASAHFTGLRSRLLGQGAWRLKDVADIVVGLQTSADDVYIVTAESETSSSITTRINRRAWTFEKEILERFLHDEQIKAFGHPRSNKWIIFPYRIVDGRAHLIQPDDMQSLYPNCWAYLVDNRQALEARSANGGITSERQWYQYGRSQSLSKFEGPKIILPILSTEARYALDRDEVRVTGGGNGPYYMIRPVDDSVPIEVLLAVLNHPLSEAIVRNAHLGISWGLLLTRQAVH